MRTAFRWALAALLVASAVVVWVVHPTTCHEIDMCRDNIGIDLLLVLGAVYAAVLVVTLGRR